MESIILKNLLYNKEYTFKTLPYIKEEYFDEFEDKIILSHIRTYIEKYNTVPSLETINIELSERDDLNENSYKKTQERLIDIKNQNNDYDNKWLIDKTEKFCQDKAIYNAVLKSVSILQDDDTTLSPGSIPSLLQDALGVTFDPTVGHDYFDDSKDRFDFYHKKEERIEFDLESFNKITKGGIPKKTLNVILAGTGVGKSLFMCHYASSCLSNGKNVLYITLEMAEEKIAERIDANLLDIPISDMLTIPWSMYNKKIENIREKTKGKLIVKEYPTASANVNHFRSLLNDLKMKKGIIPDIIFVDYLNICTSSRIKSSANVNSYSLIKSIAEELRGLAVEFDVPIFTATQTTRSGFTNSDPGLEDTSESFGLPATADFMIALVSNDELEKMGHMMVKQLKNRYNDPTYKKKFMIGVDRSKMRFYNLEQDIVDNDEQSNKYTDYDNKFKKKPDSNFEEWKF